MNTVHVLARIVIIVPWVAFVHVALVVCLYPIVSVVVMDMYIY